MQAIIYTSAAGHTRAYAHMLSIATGLEVYPLDDCQAPEGITVFYLGWIFAGRIKGLNEARKRFQVMACCGVGMSPPKPELRAVIRKKHHLSAHFPVFYLQGGFNQSKLCGLNRLIMHFKRKQIAKTMKAVETLSLEQKQLQQMAETGLSLVDKKHLMPILQWFKENDRPILGKEYHV